MGGWIESCVRVWLIASNTFIEAVRQKFFNALLWISVALVLSSTFLQQFDFGSGELKFVADFGFGALLFFGSILSIAATTQLFFSEIENRTALTMLAKPIYKLEFLAGKFIGAHLLLLVFSSTILLVLAMVLCWREAALLAQVGPGGDGGGYIVYTDLLVFGLLQWVKFGVLGAIALFVASFANTNLYTLVVSFFVMIICQLQYIARDAYAAMEAGLAQGLVALLGLVFPNFQMFNVGDQLLLKSGSGLPLSTVAQLVGYGALYIVAFLLLAQWNFRRREI